MVGTVKNNMVKLPMVNENSFLQRDFQFEYELGPPRLLLGSIRHDNVYNGEFYDSRNDRPDWARVGFKDLLTAWIMPEIMPTPINSTLNGSLVLENMLPIRAGFYRCSNI
jgi:hypothetical protein